ncbi:LPXTG cell wall anchor domain-containing protein [Occultella gossypii]|uniref:LPXTG cell wall anchor domain-containing protein n=1 Tax=Occultella gossypii TaxID=2800820 RepID=A0ABS7SH59_9MICO|nr:LPXTG cell wall anchor domain-containing protein [Occultella gossypii]MBZ2199537.1 LPXTG cell wall anchor domain-containing protein [Occultella gossypii]
MTRARQKPSVQRRTRRFVSALTGLLLVGGGVVATGTSATAADAVVTTPLELSRAVQCDGASGLPTTGTAIGQLAGLAGLVLLLGLAASAFSVRRRHGQ